MSLRHFVQLSRPFTLITPAVGVVAGAAAALLTANVPTGAWPVVAMAAGALAASLLNASSNALNQICDLEIDRVAKPARPLVTARVTVPAAWLFVILTAAASLWIATAASDYPLATFIIYGVAALLTWAYSAPPMRLRRFPWKANLTIAVPRGLLLAPAGWSLVSPLWVGDPWLIGLTPCLFLIGAAATKDFADMRADQANGVVTLPILHGPAKATRIIAQFLIQPFVLMAVGASTGVFGGGNRWVLAATGVLLALWGGWVARMLMRDPDALATTENHPSWKHMYLMMMTYYAGVVAAYSV